ncbi:MAG: helix-turn-helix domain-containing protein [Rikenellaceae bacterium]
MNISELKKRPLVSLTAEEFFALQAYENSQQTIQSAPQHSIMTIDEAASFTGYKKSTLYRKTCAGAIPHYKKEGSNKIYFRREELEEWLLGSSRKLTTEEFIEECDDKLLTRKRK